MFDNRLSSGCRCTADRHHGIAHRKGQGKTAACMPSSVNVACSSCLGSTRMHVRASSGYVRCRQEASNVVDHNCDSNQRRSSGAASHRAIVIPSLHLVTSCLQASAEAVSQKAKEALEHLSSSFTPAVNKVWAAHHGCCKTADSLRDHTEIAFNVLPTLSFHMYINASEPQDASSDCRISRGAMTRCLRFHEC